MTNEEALEILNKHRFPYCEAEVYKFYEAYDIAVKALEGQRAGHWTWVQYDGNPKIGNYHCSECGCIFAECVHIMNKSRFMNYNYCPNCGAKMQ